VMFTSNKSTYMSLSDASGSGLLKGTQYYTTQSENVGVYQPIQPNASIGVGQGFWIKVSQPITIRLVRE
jgi:hypothetical protein